MIRFTGTMAALAMGVWIAGLEPAGAAGVCDCCSGEIADICTGACEAANTGDGICRPAVFFGDASGIGGKTPLNGFSYRNLQVGEATKQELEVLRRWLERERRKAERAARRSQRQFRRRRIDAEAYAQSQRLRNEALTNYYHGIRAYIKATPGK